MCPTANEIKNNEIKSVPGPVWGVMPITAAKAKGHAEINPADVLPKNRNFRRYYGSLTTPLCSVFEQTPLAEQ